MTAHAILEYDAPVTRPPNRVLIIIAIEITQVYADGLHFQWR